MIGKTRRKMVFSYRVRPSLLSGMARILDLGNTMSAYPRFPTVQDADSFALRIDWEMVGQDIREAIREFEAEEKERLAPVG